MTGRVEEVSYIYFIDDIEDLKENFDEFECLYTGKYDFKMVEGSCEHFYFIGRKIKK